MKVNGSWMNYKVTLASGKITFRRIILQLFIIQFLLLHPEYYLSCWIVKNLSKLVTFECIVDNYFNNLFFKYKIPFFKVHIFIHFCIILSKYLTLQNIRKTSCSYSRIRWQVKVAWLRFEGRQDLRVLLATRGGFEYQT